MELQYEHPHGRLYLGDSAEWLASLDDASVDLVFADPPYNLKEEPWDKIGTQDEYIDWSICWIAQASRILKPSGSLYVCGKSEIIADLRRPAMKHFKHCRWLIWHYGDGINLFPSWTRSHQSIIRFAQKATPKFNIDDVRRPVKPRKRQEQESEPRYSGLRFKPPSHPLGAKPLDVICVPCHKQPAERTSHRTQKPEELVRKFVLASTDVGDLVIDPFSGSGTTAVVAEQLNRRWMACDINPEYNEWAVQRIESVKRMTQAEWIAYDREVARRRERGRLEKLVKTSA